MTSNEEIIDLLTERLNILEDRLNLTASSIGTEVSFHVRERMAPLEERIVKLEVSSAKFAEKADNITKLEVFKEEQEEFRIKAEHSLNAIESNYYSITQKYDRIIKDNLVIPGILGEYSRFKNMGECIEVEG